jgi:hypothetical protein
LKEPDEQAFDPGPDKIIGPGFTFRSVTDKIAGVVLKPIQTTPKQWWISLFLAFCLMQGLMAGAFWLLYKGVGVWGIMIPVGWGFAIVNFVWWIGIGHAGTLISAILLLLKQDWRTSINRFAEAMTLFAVAQAGMFPILHMGRPWLGYWLVPYPSSMCATRPNRPGRKLPSECSRSAGADPPVTGRAIKWPTCCWAA